MEQLKFSKDLYPKIGLLKAAYHFTEMAYVHLDVDDTYYYVSLQKKTDGAIPSQEDFINEMLTQSVRHAVYQQTKSIRELLMARAMATSIILEDDAEFPQDKAPCFDADEILKDWFVVNENIDG